MNGKHEKTYSNIAFNASYQCIITAEVAKRLKVSNITKKSRILVDLQLSIEFRCM